MENKALLARLGTANKEQEKENSIGAPSHFFQDISDLRQAQEHIGLSKIMLPSVFDGISDPLVTNSGTVFSVELPVRFADEWDHPGDPPDVALTGDPVASQAQ